MQENLEGFGSNSSYTYALESVDNACYLDKKSPEIRGLILIKSVSD
jgi:hypothetical protein